MFPVAFNAANKKTVLHACKIINKSHQAYVSVVWSKTVPHAAQLTSAKAAMLSTASLTFRPLQAVNACPVIKVHLEWPVV